MKKRIISFCLITILCMILSVNVFAEELKTDRLCSLNLEYSRDGITFSGLEIDIYRVAEAFPDGTFELVSHYKGYPVNIHGITSQREWQDTATTLVSYITSDRIPPSYTATTNDEGIAAWTQLPTGLYLVRSAVAEAEGNTYLFNDFMIYLPTPTDDGSFDYDLQAKPKSAAYTPAKEYTVVKLWKDIGTENMRPVSITVDIYKNDELYETVTLDAENNWSYTWTNVDGARWQVVERDVPKGYTVTVTEHETIFTITNVCTEDPPPPPDTGDTFPVQPVVMILCFLGIVLVLFGLRGSRHERKA